MKYFLSFCFGLILGIGGACVVMQGYFPFSSFHGKEKRIQGVSTVTETTPFSRGAKLKVSVPSPSFPLSPLSGKGEKNFKETKTSLIGLLLRYDFSFPSSFPLPSIPGSRKGTSGAFGDFIRFYLVRARLEALMSRSREEADQKGKEYRPNLEWFATYRIAQAGSGLTLGILGKEHPEIPRGILAPWVLYHPQFWEAAIPYLFSSYPTEFQNSLKVYTRRHFTPQAILEEDSDACLQRALTEWEFFLTLAEKWIPDSLEKQKDFIESLSSIFDLSFFLNRRNYDMYTFRGSKKEVIRKLHVLLNNLFFWEEDQKTRLDALVAVFAEKNAATVLKPDGAGFPLENEIRKVREEENFLETNQIFRKVLEDSLLTSEQRQKFLTRLGRLYIKIYETSSRKAEK